MNNEQISLSANWLYPIFPQDFVWSCISYFTFSAVKLLSEGLEALYLSTVTVLSQSSEVLFLELTKPSQTAGNNKHLWITVNIFLGCSPKMSMTRSC